MARDLYNTIIVGAGLARVAAAVYAARKKLRTLLITEEFGGQSIASSKIEMVGQGKGRSYMDMPPPGMVGNPGPHIDQALDQPVYRPLHFFAPKIELPDHMQEIVIPSCSL